MWICHCLFPVQKSCTKVTFNILSFHLVMSDWLGNSLEISFKIWLEPSWCVTIHDCFKRLRYSWIQLVPLDHRENFPTLSHMMGQATSSQGLLGFSLRHLALRFSWFVEVYLVNAHLFTKSQYLRGKFFEKQLLIRFFLKSKLKKINILHLVKDQFFTYFLHIKKTKSMLL